MAAMTRTRRHLALAAGSAVMALASAGQELDRLSFVTAWLCLLFLAGTLLIGPLHVRRTGRLPDNHLFRRDLGIWGVITGMVHFFSCFQGIDEPRVHGTLRAWCRRMAGARGP